MSHSNAHRDQLIDLGIVTTLIVLAGLARLLPHLPNVTPVGAIALFAGARLSGRWGWLAPVITLLATDAIIGWYTPAVMATVYGSFAMIGLIGLALRRSRNPLIIGGASLAGSVLFFFTTNFAVWAWTNLYPPTFTGLEMSYIQALPFFRNTVLGDLGYTALIFGAYALARNVAIARLRIDSHKLTV